MNNNSPISEKNIYTEIHINTVDASELKNMTIKKIANRCMLGLLIAFTAATAISLAALIVAPSPITLAIFSASAIGLSIILGAKGISFIKPHLPRFMQTTMNAVRSLALEILSLIPCIILYPFKVSRTDPTKKDQTDKPPVLIVHGFLHNSSCAWYLKYRLESARKELESKGMVVNYGQIFTIDLGTPFHSFEDYLQLIDVKVAEIRELTGCQEIQMVGHSMGGVLSTLYSITPETPETKIGRVVTIGSPLKGTIAAPLAFFSKAAEQMRRDSSSLGLMKEEILNTDPSTRFCHIGSTSDLIVPHKDSAWIDENRNAENHRIDGVGHIGMLFSDQVADTVIEFLQN